jgi:hypothetical protein
VPTPAELGVLVQRVAYAGLDALRAAIPLELCSYLHTTADAGPQLYLRTPDLSKMDAAAAFTLFSALRDTLDQQQTEEAETVVNGFESFSVVTAGLRSRGLFVVGRREVPLDETEREMASQLCRAVGTVAHALSDAGLTETDPTPVRVAVEVSEGTARADVLVSRAGEMRIGRGESPSPTVAVALATLDAVDSALKLLHSSEDDVGDERAVLVLVRDDDGRTALGSALCGTDHLQATAGAALQAADRLVVRRA